MELEICQLEYFGEEYRDIFKDKGIDKLYCVKNIEHILQGYPTYDIYLYYYIQFFPCINRAQNMSNCKPLSIIKEYSSETFVTFKMEDVDLTPQIYKTPISLRGKEVSANIGKTLFENVHSFFQIINLETDKDTIGIGFEKIKKVKYF